MTEAGIAVMAALNDMKRDVRNDEARLSGHKRNNGRRQAALTEFGLRPRISSGSVPELVFGGEARGLYDRRPALEVLAHDLAERERAHGGGLPAALQPAPHRVPVLCVV